MLPKTFCALPFHQLTVMNDGKTRLCCRSYHDMMSHGQPLSLNSHTLLEIWNSDYLRAVRARMLAGREVDACGQCYATEAAGVTSMRETMNALFARRWESSPEKQAAAIVHHADGAAPFPSALHLWLGNLCNLACRMCSPMFSSRNASDFVHAQWCGGQTRADASWSTNNSLLQEVFARPDCLRYIVLSGGEPLIHPVFSDILGRLVSTGHASHIDLSITSNGTIYSERLSSLLLSFASVNLAISVDGVGSLQEYIRHPSHWDAVTRNILAFQKQAVPLRIIPTVQCYNIFGLLDLARWCDEHGLRFLFDNILQAPRFLSLDMLPPAVIDEALQEWEEYLQRECRQENRWHVMAVLAALRRPRPDPDALTALQDQFVRFTNDLDRSRGDCLARACPRLHDRLIAAGFEFQGKCRFFPRDRQTARELRTSSPSPGEAAP